MSFGEKLARLRRENNLTQEQLAEKLNVSRQSVSKWESDLAYPETEKLLRISEMFDCSLDYLIRDIEDDTEQKSEEPQKNNGNIFTAINLNSLNIEYKSERRIKDLPLVHISIGAGKTARGVFAVGLSARGVIPVGMLAIGIMPVGLLSLGVVPIGVLALGLAAFGAFAAGLLAAGAISVGLIAFGAVALGCVATGAAAIGDFAVGALARGKYFAYGDDASALVAIGKSSINGELYSHMKLNMTVDEWRNAARILEQNVPAWLRWAAALALKIAGA